MKKKLLLVCILVVLILLTVLMISLIEKGFAITFHYNYEGAPKPTVVHVKYHKPLTIPEEPTRQGYAFVGWYTDQDCTQSYDFNSSIEGDLTLYASWLPIN